MGEKKDYALYLGDWIMVERVAEKKGFTLTSYDEYSEVYFGKDSKYRAFYALYYEDEESLKAQMVDYFKDFFIRKIEERCSAEVEWYIAPDIRVGFEEKVYKAYIVKSKGQIVDVVLEE